MKQQVRVILALAAITFGFLGCVVETRADVVEDINNVIDSIDLRLELGKTVIGTVDEDGSIAYGDRLTLGHKNFPIYLWGERAELNRFSILGQGTTSNTETIGYGLGVDYEILRNVKLFAEGGVVNLSYDISDFVQEEIPYTLLVGNHHVEDRPIPVTTDNCQRVDYHNCFTSTIEYDETMPVFRVGVSFAPIKHTLVYVAYKYQRTEQYIAIWDEDRHANNTGWWEERNQQDMSAVELGFMLTF